MYDICAEHRVTIQKYDPDCIYCVALKEQKEHTEYWQKIEESEKRSRRETDTRSS